jgi:hypothetical protein
MSIFSDKNGQTNYLYFPNIKSEKFSIINKASENLYSLPSVAPTQNAQIMAFNTDGSSSFVNQQGAGNPNALYTAAPLTTPNNGDIWFSDGANAFESSSSSNLNFNNSNKRLTIGTSTIKQSNSGALVLNGSNSFVETDNNLFIESGSQLVLTNVLLPISLNQDVGGNLIINNQNNGSNVQVNKNIVATVGATTIDLKALYDEVQNLKTVIYNLTNINV